MIHFLKTYSWVVLVLFFSSTTKNQLDFDKTIQHKIVVKHPGEKVGVEVILNQNLDDNGLPVEYYMDVQSVICLEQVCKVIPVKIYWNNLGEYQKYELEEGATLEKYEDDLFDPEDYPKLQTILANTDSPFKEVYIDEILTVVDEHDEESDAVSGATALELDEEDTVSGAALTCYTLWHWANGEIVEKIKEITGNTLSDNQLESALIDKNKAYYLIGIRELENRKNYTNSFTGLIINQVLIDETLLKPTFKYLEKSPAETYFKTVKTIFTKGETLQKLAVIRSLKSINYNISRDYLDGLSDEILNFNSYQELSFFLDLMESKNPNSKRVIVNVFSLLQSDLIKARRAYWFLKNSKISSAQEATLNDFFKKNKNKL